MSAIIERPVRPHVAVELATHGDVPVWTDWTDRVVKITTHRGGTQDGISIKNEVGLLTVTLRGIGFNTIVPDFYAGQQIRLYYVNGENRHPLFTGQIRDLEKQVLLVNRERIPVLQLIAVDAVSEHNAVTRYGAIPPSGAETFISRIARLTPTATAPIEQPTGTYDGALLGRTVYESTLANHFTLACNTARAMWWVGPDNVTRFQPRRYDTDNPVTFVEFYQPFETPQPDDLHIVHETLIAGTRVMFNAITKHVLGAEPGDDPGTWKALEEDVRGAFLIGSIDRYGRREVILTTNDADFLPDDDTRWLSQFGSIAGVIGSILWNAQEDLTRIPDLEIGTSVWAPRTGTGGEDSPPEPQYIIIGVHHTITPTRWMVELTLIGA